MKAAIACLLLLVCASPALAQEHAAEAIYPADRMAAARRQLAEEHGGMPWSKAELELAEANPASGGYAWQARASIGGDINRWVVKSEGYGDRQVDHAEVQALYSKAIGPYFNFEAGLRQDLEAGPRRTYATLGLEGLAPYGIEVEGAVFLSQKGEAFARLETWTDFRLTQRLILQPRVEVNLAAQRSAELGLGGGLNDADAGLRLRYEFTRHFAPYVGLHRERSFGRTAAIARAAGDRAGDTRLVVGLRSWF